MNRSDIWMPMYIGDYLGDTCRLSTEQHGAYLLLILDYWRKGPPPDDDAVLARIARLDDRAWSMHRAMLEQFFRIDQGCWRHARIDAELSKAHANAASRSKRAKTAAEARWRGIQAQRPDVPSNAPSTAPSMLQAVPDACPSPSPSELTSSPSRESGGSAEGVIAQNQVQRELLPPSDTSPKKPGDAPRALPSKTSKRRKTPLGQDWVLPQTWGQWALQEMPDWTPERVRTVAEQFKDYQFDKDARSADWAASWRNWVRKEDGFARRRQGSGSGPGAAGNGEDAWWNSDAGIDRKGKELGIHPLGTESYQAFKQRLFVAIKGGGR